MNTELIEKFTIFLNNEPLLESKESIKGIDQSLFDEQERSIFYGTGLCTQTDISIGLPFDVLGIIFVAERIRKMFGFTDVYHHIADTHAKSNHIFDPRQVDQLAQKTKLQLEKVFHNFGLDHFTICLASEFDTTPEYEKIYKKAVPRTNHEYVTREIADIRWYASQHNTKLKIGWMINTGDDQKQGNDEMLFDNNYNQLFPRSMSFIYLTAGRTFDKTRQRVSPYILLPTEKRFSLVVGENAKEKLTQAELEWGDKYFGGTRKHLENIVHTYEKLFGNLLVISFEEKVQLILDRAMAE